MATVTVRNLDDEVRRLLRIRAAGNDRSMEAEIRDILTQSVTASPRSATRPRQARQDTSSSPSLERSELDLSVLTPRERTVSALVAQGLTNRQIAAELYLSERTVESHVSSVLSKFGLRSRAGVAALLATRGSGS